MDAGVAALIGTAIGAAATLAAALVILEGPSSIAEAADHIEHASRDLSQVVRRPVVDARAGDTTPKSENLELAAERERAVYRTIADFRKAARDTLAARDRPA